MGVFYYYGIIVKPHLNEPNLTNEKRLPKIDFSNKQTNKLLNLHVFKAKKKFCHKKGDHV